MNKLLVSMLMILSICAQSNSKLATKETQHQLTELFDNNTISEISIEDNYTQLISDAIADALKWWNKRLLSDLTT